MAKRLGKLPKESGMSSRTEAKSLLWELFPPAINDNRKSWFTRLARFLGWNERRVRAIWHEEARIITADEWRTLQALKESAATRRERLNELAYQAASLRTNTGSVGGSARPPEGSAAAGSGSD